MSCIWLFLVLLADSHSPSLDPLTDFEPGIARGIRTLSAAQEDPLWVDKSIRGYELSEEPPWRFKVYYSDDSTLSIPLSLVWFKPAAGPTMTVFRRHKETRRLVPFVVPLDPANRLPSLASLPHEEAVARVAVPRFDPRLTPAITQALNEAQIVYTATGTLKVLQLQLMNPLAVAGPLESAAAAARGASTRVAALAAATRIVPGGGLATHEALGGHLLARHIALTEAQLASRLTTRSTLKAASTFSSRAVAEQVLSEAIQANEARIFDWLKSGAWKIVLRYNSNTPVGLVMPRGTGGVVSTTSIEFVLVRTDKLSFGWRILTGYPCL